MELESFVVVMDSRTYYIAGDGQQNRQYYFDWSVIPDGKYELTFSFVSDGTTMTLFTQYCLFSNMISPQNVYQAGSGIGASTTPFLGYIVPNGLSTAGGATNVFSAERHTNAPIICNRPMTNIFTIGVFDGLSGTLATVFTDYVLTLHFKPLRLGLA